MRWRRRSARSQEAHDAGPEQPHAGTDHELFGRHHPEALAIGLEAEKEAHEAAEIVSQAARSVVPEGEGDSAAGAAAVEAAISKATELIRAWQPGMAASIIEAWGRSAIEISAPITTAIRDAGRAAAGSDVEVASALRSAIDSLVEAGASLFMSATTLMLAGPDEKAVATEYVERSRRASAAAKVTAMGL